MNKQHTNQIGIVMGGDLRQVHLANCLSKIMDIIVTGIEQSDDMLDPSVIHASGTGGLPGCPDFLFLPMPVMSGDYLNAPMSPDKITLQQALHPVGDDTIVFGGQIDTHIAHQLNQKNIVYHDYLNREELAVMNSIATAEGAIEIILRELPITIFGLKVMIVGSGRISKILRRILLAMGATVYVTTRTPAECAWISIDGCHPIQTSHLTAHIYDVDVIVNTVPAKVLTEKVLSHIQSSTLLIDLASKPGGVDFEEANRLGIRTIWALSLPGKTAPISSGEIIYQTILNIIEEHHS